jgi:maltooligosyltrehalose trehalohydrolase
VTRRYPIGAEVQPEGGVHFRVWAPKRRQVEVVLEGGGATELACEHGGYSAGLVADAGDGSRYRFRLDGGDAFPDPASRFQPDGPHGASQVVDPTRFEWSDRAWRGVGLEGQVISEIHIGTFTHEGTWAAAMRELSELARVGITVVEVMPVAEFPGRFGWGYDGVDWFAPVHLYGSPDDFRRFVDEAHRVGLGVILDVVYNHIGPDGNYLRQFSDDYFSDQYANEWGEALNFDGPNASGMRELVAMNAAYWADEYHLDGLRLDATQQIFDSSAENIISVLARSMRAAASPRRVFLVAEDETQRAQLATPEHGGGYGLDGLWNDDFHHAARVAATGRNEAYYSPYRGTPQELISAARFGYLYQGQVYHWQMKRRGSPARGLERWQFVCYLQNHDQISNAGRGERLQQITSPGRYRALTAYLLLAPGTPLLFQGQEFAASTPFRYFADHQGELRQQVKEGRIQFLSQFPSLAQPENFAWHSDPGEPATFEECKLDFGERRRHASIYQMHIDLLKLRREDTLFRKFPPGGLDGAVLGPEALLLRYFGEAGNDRLLLVNLGLDLDFIPCPEPLLAPPAGCSWEVAWSSEDPRYGGSGTQPPEQAEGWRIPGHAALVMRSCPSRNLWET